MNTVIPSEVEAATPVDEVRVPSYQSRCENEDWLRESLDVASLRSG